MKKSTLLLMMLVLVLATTAVDCSDDIPNPGFGAIAVDRTGLLSSFERALPGAVTDWHHNFDGEGATGNRFNFFTQGGSAGQTLVDQGRAPAGYNIRAVQDWGPCTGLNGVQFINRGVWNYVPCRRGVRMGFRGGTFIFSPSPVDVNNTSGWEFSVSGSVAVLSTQYGMPYFEFRDSAGNLRARQQASYCHSSGTWARGPASCLAYLPEGEYGVEIVNKTPDGIGEVVAVADVLLVDHSGPPPCDSGQICQ